MDRRMPATVALALLVLLAGCSYAQNNVRPEITAITDTGSGYRLDGVVTQNTRAYNETPLHDLRVLGYGADGSLACEAALGDVPGDVEPNFAMVCSRIPLIVLVDSDDRKRAGSPNEDPYANFQWHAIRYAGYDESTGHRWADTMEVDRIGNPPGNVSGLGGTDAYEFVKCRLRVANANVSVFDDAAWADSPPRPPDSFEIYEVRIHPANDTSRTARWGGTIVDTLGSPRLNDSVSQAAEFDRTDSYYVNGTTFLRTASLLEGRTVTDLRAMPGPNESDHVRHSDTRAETCYLGAGTYEGRLLRTYEYAVDYRPPRGEQLAPAVVNRTVIVELQFRRLWQDRDDGNEPPCRGEDHLTDLGERYCG